jgi:OmpA-OmpF porin, OOP family
VKKFLLSALIVAGSVGVHAEGLYVGLAAGGSHSNLDCERASSCDRNGTGFKLLGGYKLTDNVAVEAHYADYGKAKGKFSGDLNAIDINIDAKLSGYGAGIALQGDFSRDWNGVVRAGLASNKVTAHAWTGGLSVYASETRTRAYIGAGVGYQLTKDVSLTAAIDYTQGEFMHDKVNATLYTIGANYNF